MLTVNPMSVRSQCLPRASCRYIYCPIHQSHIIDHRRAATKATSPYDMNWPLPTGAHLLAPFDHQVAGQSSMLRYDETTVCKPLIAREHFVYQTLPEGLKEFTPDYRGELEVGLAEKDGYLQLYGLCVKDDSNEDLCQCSLQSYNMWEDCPGPDVLNGKEANMPPAFTNGPNISSELIGQNRCVIRVLRSGSYEICSPASDITSTHPNTNTKTPSLNPWSLKNHKRLLDKMRKGKHRHNSFRCILLKNVVADFKYPCILDLKIGSRLHGDEANPKKVESQSRKCAETTSISLGVRLCGMQVYQKGSGEYFNLDKFQGRLLTDETFKKTLVRFLHNGLRYRTELLQPIVTKLSNLIKCLHTIHTYRFYASSLLIIYDGAEEYSTNMGLHQDLTKSQIDQTIRDKDFDPCTKQLNGHDLWSLSSHTHKTSGDNGDIHNLTADSQKHTSDNYQTPCSTSCPMKDEGHGCDVSTNDSTASITHEQHIPDSHTSTPSPPIDNNKYGPKSPSNQILCMDRLSSHSQSHVTSDPDTTLLCDNNCGQTSPQTTKDRPMHQHCNNQPDSPNHSKIYSTANNNKHSVQRSSSPSHAKTSSNKNNQNNSINAQLQQLCKVDVKMIDFAHTTHQGFPDDVCRHEGPDMDYIQGLTNLKMLFENLMAEC